MKIITYYYNLIYLLFFFTWKRLIFCLINNESYLTINVYKKVEKVEIN